MCIGQRAVFLLGLLARGSRREVGRSFIHEWPRRGLLGNSVPGRVLTPGYKTEKGLRLEAAREVRSPLIPVILALLSYPPFVGRRIVQEGDSRVRNLGVPAAIVADERCPSLATQYFVEFDPGSLQLA